VHKKLRVGQPGQWRITELARSTLERGRRGWDRGDRVAQWRWLAILGAGAAIGVAATAMAALVLRDVLPEPAAFEIAVLRWLARSPFTVDVAELVAIPGGSVFMLPWVLALAVIAARRERTVLALSIAAAWIIPGLFIVTGWMLWDRPRPELVAEVDNPALPSFPSGHVAHTVAVYGFLGWLWAQLARRRGERVVAYACAVLVCVAVIASRLRLGAHWAVDVGAGALLGLFWATVVVVATRAGEAVAVHRGGAYDPRPLDSGET